MKWDPTAPAWLYTFFNKAHVAYAICIRLLAAFDWKRYEMV